MRLLVFTALALTLAPIADAASPWNEEDGPDVVIIAESKFRCGPRKEIELLIWQPYNTATQKTLDFKRVTSTNNEPLAGRMTYKDNTFFYDGIPCEQPEG